MDIPSLPFSDPHHSILMSSIHSSNPAEGAPITEPQIIDKTGEDMDNDRIRNNRSKEEEMEEKEKKVIAGVGGRRGARVRREGGEEEGLGQQDPLVKWTSSYPEGPQSWGG